MFTLNSETFRKYLMAALVGGLGCSAALGQSSAYCRTEIGAQFFKKSTAECPSGSYEVTEVFARTAIEMERDRESHATKMKHASESSERFIAGAVRGFAVLLLLCLLALPAFLYRRHQRRRAEESRNLEVAYVQALDELENLRTDRATWARAMAESDGSEISIRGKYVQLRATALTKTASI